MLIANLFLVGAFMDRQVQMIGEANDEELLKEIESRDDLWQDKAFHTAIVYYRDLTLFENIRDYVICNLIILAISIFVIKYDERNNIENVKED